MASTSLRRREVCGLLPVTGRVLGEEVYAMAALRKGRQENSGPKLLVRAPGAGDALSDESKAICQDAGAADPEDGGVES